MITEEEDYTAYITSQYKNSIKFNALVDLLTNVIKKNALLAKKMPEYFDIDTAVGQQLDFIGQWIGFSRYIYPAIDNIFFSWDTTNKGFEEGYWKRPFDDGGGYSILEDDVYRIILKVKIVLNHFKGQPDVITEQLSKIFSPNNVILEDKQDMSFNLGVTGYVTPLFQTLLTRGYFLIKPSGVKINYIQPSNQGNYFFGFDIQNQSIDGWDMGGWYQSIPTL